MYKLELFNDQLEFSDAAMIAEQPIDLDYLALDPFTLSCQSITCQKGYFAHITKGSRIVADAVISDVQPGSDSIEISCRPLQAFFDVEVFPSPINDAAAWLKHQITEQFISNSDPLQNRPISITSTITEPYPLSIDGDTVNLTDIMAAALTTYSIVCNCRLDLNNKQIRVEISQPMADIVIETDLENVLEKSITLGDSYGAANKLIIRKEVTDESSGSVTYPEQVTYFLHPDGAIDTINDNRITPVFWELATISGGDSWEQKAQEKAIEVLTPQNYDNEIIVTYSDEDAILHPLELGIGSRASIYINGVAYRSILTGTTMEPGKVSLVFGQVRVPLTKRLILERRAK